MAGQIPEESPGPRRQNGEPVKNSLPKYGPMNVQMSSNDLHFSERPVLRKRAVAV